jgi:methionyl-tRNA formyltransferase
VAAYAREHGLPLWQTATLRGEEAEARLRAVEPEGMALAAFAALVPANLLELAPQGILNVHPSLLPRWRGASPIQAALLAGDRETGVSIIRLVKAMDAGPILLQERVPVASDDDYVTLEPRLAALGAQMLVRALADNPLPWAQDDEQATYCKRIERDDARIDWSQPAEAIWRQVRAYRGWPQAFTTHEGRLLKVLRATPVGDASISHEERDSEPHGRSDASPGSVVLENGELVVTTGRGSLRLDEVQLEGRRAMSGAELARGYPRLNGAKLA